MRRFFIYFLVLFSSDVYLSSCFEIGLDAGDTVWSFGNYIDIDLHKFSPDTLSITQGESVTWWNKGTDYHIVTSNDNFTFKSDTIKEYPGHYYYKSSISGTFKYHCFIHPSETGVLIVKP